MNGFTFDGIHTSQQQCYYTPDAKARGELTADFEVSDLNDDARNGGYFIGTRVKPREFSLECYFEEITASKLEEIRRWLHRGRQGQ